MPQVAMTQQTQMTTKSKKMISMISPYLNPCSLRRFPWLGAQWTSTSWYPNSVPLDFSLPCLPVPTLDGATELVALLVGTTTLVGAVVGVAVLAASLGASRVDQHHDMILHQYPANVKPYRNKVKSYRARAQKAIPQKGEKPFYKMTNGA